MTDDNLKPVLHLVSYDVARGAEVYARALVDALNLAGRDANRLVTLFRGEGSQLAPDHALDVPRGPLRRVGFDPRVVTRLRRLKRRVDPKLVVAHGGEPAKYASFLGSRPPYAYLSIGSSHPLLESPIRRMMRKRYLARAKAVVAVSSQLAAEIAAESSGWAGRVTVIPNGRDPVVYRPSQGPEVNPPRILFIGHLDEQKRPDLFVAAMESLIRAGVEFQAAIIGSGPLEAHVAQLAAPLGIEVMGARDDVPEQLARSSLVVATSRPPEGMPGVLIEAGMAGLPVVTTTVPGATDVVVDGETGVVMPVDSSADQIGSAVVVLLDDADKMAAMGEAARERCVGLFSLSSAVGRWESLFGEIDAGR